MQMKHGRVFAARQLSNHAVGGPVENIDTIARSVSPARVCRTFRVLRGGQVAVGCRIHGRGCRRGGAVAGWWVFGRGDHPVGQWSVKVALDLPDFLVDAMQKKDAAELADVGLDALFDK